MFTSQHEAVDKDALAGGFEDRCWADVRWGIVVG